jgi:nuclear pore complex protein Nup98-Nup96
MTKNSKKKSKLFSSAASAASAASAFEPIKIIYNNNAPKVNNPLIELYPSLQELKQMTTEELKTIKNFTIFHKKFGHIEFIGITDVSNINIDEDIIFNQSTIELYPFQNVPAYNTKLNKPAIVTLYNCYSNKIKELVLSDNDSLSEQSLLKQLEYKYKLKLINICETCDYMDFISYTLEGGIWKFQIDGIRV